MVAIGGINQSNPRVIRESGASGITVISAVSRAKNMETAALELPNQWQTLCSETSNEPSARTNPAAGHLGPHRDS